MINYRTTRFHELRLRLENHVSGGGWSGFWWEFFLFGFKQAWACLFGAILLAAILITKLYWPGDFALPRYDFLFLLALTAQVLLLLFRLETLREAKVILVFHVIGTAMELFKTHVGAWTYPGDSVIRVGHVPLFSGFMYASVGSYLARTSRILDMRYTRFPPARVTAVIAVLIYANFFLHHLLPDMRVVLFGLVLVTFGPTWVYYRPYQKFRRMPLLLGFSLVALFLWGAENVGTFGAIWIYPYQGGGWKLVHISKYGSWFLLMIISFILVSFVHSPRLPPPGGSDSEVEPEHRVRVYGVEERSLRSGD